MILVMPGAPSDVAERRAEQFRKTIEDLVIPLEGKVLDAFTVSIGVAAYPEHGTTKEALSRSADEALHQAKAAGRNRVVVAKRFGSN
jgi:diguanylate cyclase (GGDEF)-like protein